MHSLVHVAAPVAPPPLESSPPHRREHHSVLARSEKRLLVWLAERTPRWLNSDHLTLLGLMAMLGVGFGFAFWRSMRGTPAIVLVCLFLNWLGDSLDGTLARARRQERPRYGYYVDHVVDMIGATALFGGLALSGLMQPAIALAVLIAYLLIASESFLATHSVGVFRISFLGFGPTELRLVLAAGVLKVWTSPHVSIGGLGSVPLFDVGGLVATAGMAMVFLASTVRNTRAAARAEPRPAQSPRVHTE